MTQVIANLAMSIDGFIADPDGGCDDLFGFYDNGGPSSRSPTAGRRSTCTSRALTLLREAVARIGCHVMGRDLYDMTNGWEGHPGNEAPIVVLTHHAAGQHPDGVPYFFVADVEAAVAQAREVAGDLDVVDRRRHGGAAGARRRAARRHRREPGARGARARASRGSPARRGRCGSRTRSCTRAAASRTCATRC